MNKNKRYTISLIAILFVSVVLISGGTFAYLRWVTANDQKTALNINVTQQIRMSIDNPSASKFGMYPTVNCGGEAGMSFVSIVSIENQTGLLAAPEFKLKVRITDKSGNVITNQKSAMDAATGGNNPYRYYINYAVAEENGSCTEPLYRGRFDVNQQTVSGSSDWYDSELITIPDEFGYPTVTSDTDGGVSFFAPAYKTTTHNYKIWFWVDSSYTTVVSGNNISTDKLQNANISVSFSENSTVEQIAEENNPIPTCYLGISNDNKIIFTSYSPDVTSYGLTTSSSPNYNSTSQLSLTTGTIYGYVKDSDGYEGRCSIDIQSTTTEMQTIACDSLNYGWESNACPANTTYVSDDCNEIPLYEEKIYECTLDEPISIT